MMQQSNPDYTVCPKCGENMEIQKRGSVLVFDGNSVFQCTANKKHRFWKNSREHSGIIHYHPQSSRTLFKSLADYEWEDGQWQLQEE
jgi:hypothetical protein